MFEVGEDIEEGGGGDGAEVAGDVDGNGDPQREFAEVVGVGVVHSAVTSVTAARAALSSTMAEQRWTC